MPLRRHSKVVERPWVRCADAFGNADGIGGGSKLAQSIRLKHSEVIVSQQAGAQQATVEFRHRCIAHLAGHHGSPEQTDQQQQGDEGQDDLVPKHGAGCRRRPTGGTTRWEGAHYSVKRPPGVLAD
jgi:hypothetical protein